MNRISKGLVPPGGWAFQQGSILIRGQTWDELVKFVSEHRRTNNIEMGDLEDEIEDQICENHPSIIINGPKSKKNQWE